MINRAVKLISLLVFAFSQFSLANEPHDDLRLFFLSSEHAESKTINPADNQVVTKTNTKGAGDDIDLSTVKPSPTKIWFSAVVRKDEGIQLLVNDLPCRVVLNKSQSQVENSIGVKCGHINQKYYLLRHRLDNQALIIYKNEKYIATLFVGQSL